MPEPRVRKYVNGAMQEIFVVVPLGHQLVSKHAKVLKTEVGSTREFSDFFYQGDASSEELRTLWE